MPRENAHPRLDRRMPRRGGACGARRQQGTVAVVVAIFLAIAVAALGALDIGNVFFARRSLQRVADLAALAAAQTMDDTCTQPVATATSNAGANGFAANAAGQSLTVVCGRWDVKDNGAPSYFAAATSQLNAVQVTATRSVPYFFLGPARNVGASSTAQATNLGAFTIGTTLAQLQGGLLNGVLNGLLGANLSLSVGAYESLASARIKIKDLMAAANVGTVDALLATRVTVPQLANLLLTALSTTSAADANLAADLATLQAIAGANIASNSSFPIGNAANAAGLVALDVADSQSALDATLSPFDALVVGAEIAQAGQAPVAVASGLQIAGLTATLQVQIIQAPVLAVGEAGIDPATRTWRTEARTAQVRLYLNIGLGTADLPLGLLGALLPVQVSLPLSLEVAPGQAWLQSTDCTSAAATSTSVIGVQTGIADVCVGDAPANLSASQPFSCATPATLVNALNLVTIKANAAIPAVVPSSSAATLTFDGISGNADDYQSTNANAVGNVLGNALSGLSVSLAQPNALTVSLVGMALPLGPIASGLASFLTPLVGPVLVGLDQVVEPLLQLLGVQIGVSTVHDLSLTCGASQLVD